MSRHIIEAEITCRFQPVGLTDMESGQMVVEIEYDYSPGRPAYTPRGEYAPIDPPEPAEVSFVGVKLIDASDLGFDPDQAWVNDKAQDWLYDAGYQSACEFAEDESSPDPDRAYDEMRDRRDDR